MKTQYIVGTLGAIFHGSHAYARDDSGTLMIAFILSQLVFFFLVAVSSLGTRRICETIAMNVFVPAVFILINCVKLISLAARNGL